MQNLPSSGSYVSGLRGSALRETSFVQSGTTAVRPPSTSAVRAIVVTAPVERQTAPGPRR